MIAIFLDTEFTDFKNPQLISLGVIAKGVVDFYVEVPFELDACSDFVKTEVLPKLWGEVAFEASKKKLSLQMQGWIESASFGGREKVEVLYDFSTDWSLFVTAFGGRIPSYITHRNVSGIIDDQVCEDFLKVNNLPSHHALNDARALEHAYKVASEPEIDDAQFDEMRKRGRR